MRKIILLILGILLVNLFFFSFWNITGFSIEELVVEREEGFVTKVIDGDTIVINGESVRLLSMDTAERGEPCYSEAKKRLETLVLNKEVLLEKEGRDRDQYKRLLRHVFIQQNGTIIHVNLLLVQEGLATARFYEDEKYRKEILAAEKHARENSIGCKWITA